MIWKRQLAIFGIAFALVLGGGMALAAVGSLAPSNDDVASEEPYEEPEATTTTKAHEEPEGDHEEEGSGEDEGDHGDEPRDQPKDEPREEPKDEEPADEPKDEAPADEPKDEAPQESDTTPPDFGITTPENGAHTDDKVFTFKGFVEPGSTVTRAQWTADQEGEHWAMTLVLAPGKNVVGFIATDAAGNVSDAAVTVYYEAPAKEEPKDEPKDEEPSEVAWSANQQYGSCDESPPYDVFYGTATPGTKIWIESPYGGKTVTANDDGHWEAKVHFYEVPAGKSFEVVIESNNGNRKVFGFTYTGGGEEGGGGEEH